MPRYCPHCARYVGLSYCEFCDEYHGVPRRNLLRRVWHTVWHTVARTNR